MNMHYRKIPVFIENGLEVRDGDFGGVERHVSEELANAKKVTRDLNRKQMRGLRS